MNPPAEVEIAPPADFRLSWEPMNLEQAQAITTKIGATAKALCFAVRDAYNGQAWVPLEFATWEDYTWENFGWSRQRAHQLIQHADKLDLMAAGLDVAADTVAAIPERATRGLSIDDVKKIVTQVVMDLPANSTTGVKLAAIDRGMNTLRSEVRKVKAQVSASTTVDNPDPAPEASAAAEAIASLGPDASPEDRLTAAMGANAAAGVGLPHKDTNQEKAGGDDGPDTAGDAAVSGDGASGQDAGQSDSEPPAETAATEQETQPAPSPDPQAPRPTHADASAPGDGVQSVPGETSEGAAPPPAAPSDPSGELIAALVRLAGSVLAIDPKALAAELVAADQADRSEALTLLDDLAEHNHQTLKHYANSLAKDAS